MTDLHAPALLLAATWSHLAFQASVSTLVYPALAEVPVDRWRPAHDLHSRRITPVVGVLYAGLVLASTAAVVDSPDPATLTAVATTVGALLVTAGGAAPLHSRLGSPQVEPGTPRHRTLVTRLRRVDLVRTVLAAAAAAAALVAVTATG